ncbi:MAG: lyase family protein [Acidobacteriaceae bacterium]
MMPGNPRYQPKELVPFFGYDNLVGWMAQVEIAGLNTLGRSGIIPPEDFELLTDEVIKKVGAIPTSEVDRVESEKTKHDVRAWVLLAKEVLPEKLHRWVHVPYTSYDALDTGRSLMFIRAYRDVIKPKTREVIRLMAGLVEKFATQVQIGRTHGQHALPITVGFWLATILSRVMANYEMLQLHSEHLVGKISGAVGAYNAQVALGFDDARSLHSAHTFEQLILDSLGLPAARISTQILPPEPLAYFLHACAMMSATFGQFGRDCRHLMRSEIGEIAEEFESGQVGSSTMAHKRNPISFENLEGMWLRTKNEYGKVFDTLLSEHQRDLVGSSVYRDFPIIPINLTVQLNTLLRKNKAGVPFLSRITVSKDACEANLKTSAAFVLAEPIYIALQMAGYPHDAHKLINEQAMAVAKEQKIVLFEALYVLAEKDFELDEALSRIPQSMRNDFYYPERYVGKAREKALEIVALARELL